MTSEQKMSDHSVLKTDLSNYITFVTGNYHTIGEHGGQCLSCDKIFESNDGLEIIPERDGKLTALCLCCYCDAVMPENIFSSLSNKDRTKYLSDWKKLNNIE